MNVPFVDLKRQYHQLKPEMDAAIHQVIDELAFIKGKHVSDFERAFENLYGVKHCIGVANGTDAIFITLKMLGIGPGDEVITVANSWIATSETISLTGAKPVFVDVDEYFSIDAQAIEGKITLKTKAIIPVHLYGQMSAMDEIMELAEKHQIFVVEDCAQSHFSSLNGKRAGTIGVAGTFSFYPGKNLGAYGDAGAIITNDDALSEKLRMFANHGSLIKHQHQIEGVNSRLDGLQAAILRVKLDHILDWTAKRQGHALAYDEGLRNVIGVEVPKVRSNSEHSYHLYVIKAERRDELREYLKSKGIATGIHYPQPLPLLTPYASMGHQESDFPKAVANRDTILSLPMFPELTVEERQYVIDKIAEFYC